MGRCRALKIPTLAPYLNSSLSSYYTPSPSKLSLASAFNIDLDLFPPNREHSEAASAPHYPPNTLVPIWGAWRPAPSWRVLTPIRKDFPWIEPRLTLFAVIISQPLTHFGIVSVQRMCDEIIASHTQEVKVSHFSQLAIWKPDQLASSICEPH